MADTTHILEKIRKEIYLKYKSLSKFAIRIEAVRQTLDFQLKGKSKMTIDTYLDICNALEVHPCYFLDESYKDSKYANFKVNGSAKKYYNKNEMNEDSFMQIQQENMNLRKKMQSAHEEMRRLQEANLKLIDMLADK